LIDYVTFSFKSAISIISAIGRRLAQLCLLCIQRIGTVFLL